MNYVHPEQVENLQQARWAAAERGWSLTRLAASVNMRLAYFSNLCTGTRQPSRDTADKLQCAFGFAGVYLDVTQLWPKLYAQKDSLPETWLEPLTQHPEVLRHAVGDTVEMELEDVPSLVQSMLDKLPYKGLSTVITLRYFEGCTLEEAKQRMHLSRARIQQAECKALHILRHPARLARIREHVGLN